MLVEALPLTCHTTQAGLIPSLASTLSCVSGGWQWWWQAGVLALARSLRGSLPQMILAFLSSGPVHSISSELPSPDSMVHTSLLFPWILDLSSATTSSRKSPLIFLAWVFLGGSALPHWTVIFCTLSTERGWTKACVLCLA